ncbi:MAG: hypothetical protein ABEJ65_03125 [bacterium]
MNQLINGIGLLGVFGILTFIVGRFRDEYPPVMKAVVNSTSVWSLCHFGCYLLLGVVSGSWTLFFVSFGIWEGYEIWRSTDNSWYGEGGLSGKLFDLYADLAGFILGIFWASGW